MAAGLFISLIPTIFPTVGGKNKAEPANENGTISRIMWPIIFMLGSVRNIDLYINVYVFIYLGSPILGRVTATARDANYCRPVTVPLTTGVYVPCS